MIRLLCLAFFGFAMAIISMMRLLGDVEPGSLVKLKRIFGRKVGLAVHFSGHVALPLLVGVIFTCESILAFSPQVFDRRQFPIQGTVRQMVVEASHKYHRSLAMLEAGYLMTDLHYPPLCP
ncbi:MAG: hypothetical protein C0616_10075 [Desulfuromonas sp.]|nr:MAG: hypothetical protein C0616_10075 [Desulfuromonas sp.]